MIKTKILLFLSFLVCIAFYGCAKENVNPEGEDYKMLGSSSADLLTSSRFDSLTIEIQYMPGYLPSEAVKNNLVNFLNTFLNKPGGIRVFEQEISPGSFNKISLAEIIRLERVNRREFTGTNSLAVHVFILDTDYASPGVMGVSYWNTSICIFGRMVNQNLSGSSQISKDFYYTTLLNHEFGHLMGLVDLGAPMQQPHRDIAHGYHCNDASCLMYYGVENTDFAPLLTNGAFSFDTNCLNDLKANGSK